MQSQLIALQKFLVQNRSIIENTFLLIELLIFGNIIVVGFLLNQQRLDLIDVYDLGKLFGVMALGWYSLSLVPGILKRLRFQPLALVGVMLMLFRRHFGIMMFMSALTHYVFTTIFYFTFSGVTPFLSPAQTFGWFAFLVAMPLWVTSNSISEKKLGKWWKRVHKLTYLILLLVFGHLLLFMTKWAWLAGSMLVIELLSWAVAWRRDRSQAKGANMVQ